MPQPFESVRLAVLTTLAALTAPAVLAAPAVCELDVLGTKYEVHQIAPFGGIYPTITALGNEIDYGDPGEPILTATAVGWLGGIYAGAFSVENGSSNLGTLGAPNGSRSRSEDISPNTGVIVGWRRDGGQSGPWTSFVFSNENGMRLLGDVYPSVRTLNETPQSNGALLGSRALQVNDRGDMILQAGTTGKTYKLTEDGILREIQFPDCTGVDLNNLGNLPPPGAVVTRTTSQGATIRECATYNYVHNDTGMVAGIIVGQGAHRDGALLPGGSTATPTSINSAGMIGASPGFVWSQEKARVDIRAEIIRQCDTTNFFAQPNPNGISNVYVNDQKWISYANLLLRPSCPKISVSPGPATGFEFVNGRPAVRVGNRFSSTLIVRNDGSVPLENFSVVTTSLEGFARRLNTATLHGTLMPGQSMSGVAEWEAVGGGTWRGHNTVTGDSNCGTISVSTPESVIEFIGEVENITVNSTADRARAANATSCDTGQRLGNGDAECTLRAAIQTVNADDGSTIRFAIPGATIPRILLSSALPDITKPVKIDGTTQDAGRVELSGNGLSVPGLNILGGNSEIRGLIVNGFAGAQGIGIRLGSNNNKVTGSYLGTNAAGNAAARNVGSIVIRGGASNTIGGTSAADANIISGSDFGVVVVGETANNNRIIGNRIGLAANGGLLRNRVSVAINGGSGNVVGGAGAEGNRIAASDVGVSVTGPTPIANTTIQGNRIGLNFAGTAGLLADDDASMGVFVLGTAAGAVTVPKILDNRIAGNSIDVLVALASGAQVTGNRVGFTFDDSGALPAGIEAGIQEVGIRVDAAPAALISNNVVAGHQWNVLIAGNQQFEIQPGPDTNGDGVPDSESYDLSTPDSPLASSESTGNDVQVTQNTIGLNHLFAVPSGAQQGTGIGVFGGARFANIVGNTVAGHAENEIWLSDGSGHTVAGNRIGTSTGNEHGSQRGVFVEDATQVVIGGDGLETRNIISRNQDVGIEVSGDAEGVRIANNYIGTDVGGASAWANGIGIRANGVSGVIIEDNVIGGNRGAGVALENAELTVLQSNRIGVSPNGVAVANGVGVELSGTPAHLFGNTIAHNNGEGIHVAFASPVHIRGNPIYENGDGGEGIAYDVPPFAPPPFVIAMRTKPDEESDKVGLLIAVPAVGGEGEVTLEIFGNRSCEDPQGRVPLLRQTVDAKNPLLKLFTTDSISAFGSLDGFTATVTRGESTSAFSPCADVQPWTDSDDDGADDVVEALAGDVNGDGIADIEQPNVAVHLLEEGRGVAAIVSPEGTRLQGTFAMGVNFEELDFLYGVFGFDVQGLDSGAQTMIEIILEEPPTAEQVYVKMPRVDSDDFVEMPETEGADRAERTARGWKLHLTDGGRFDTDGAANGRIRDPGGPAVRVQAPSPPQAPQPPVVVEGSRKGGGGAIDPWSVGLLLVLCGCLVRLRLVKHEQTRSPQDRRAAWGIRRRHPANRGADACETVARHQWARRFAALRGVRADAADRGRRRLAQDVAGPALLCGCLQFCRCERPDDPGGEVRARDARDEERRQAGIDVRLARLHAAERTPQW